MTQLMTRARRWALQFAALSLLAVGCQNDSPSPGGLPTSTLGAQVPHCHVTVTGCTDLRRSNFRHGLWDLSFTADVRGAPKLFVAEVATQLDAESLCTPARLATLTQGDGSPVALAPDWESPFGPTLKSPLTTFHFGSPRERMQQLPSGEWQATWGFTLVCLEPPVGAVTIALDLSKMSTRVWRGAVELTCEGGTFTVPPVTTVARAGRGAGITNAP